MKSYKSYTRDGAFLSKADVIPPVTWTVSNASEQIVTTPGKQPATKLILYFQESTKKGLVVNATNGDTLCAMTGSEDPERWVGTRVEIYVDEAVKYAGKTTGGIRVRKPANAPF